MSLYTEFFGSFILVTRLWFCSIKLLICRVHKIHNTAILDKRSEDIAYLIVELVKINKSTRCAIKYVVY